jgi:hypothetical protein
MKKAIYLSDNNIVYAHDKKENGNYHRFEIHEKDTFIPLSGIGFQKGLKYNKDYQSGVTELDLLSIVRERLSTIQASVEHNSKEIEQALLHIQETMFWLEKGPNDKKQNKLLETYHR